MPVASNNGNNRPTHNGPETVDEKQDFWRYKRKYLTLDILDDFDDFFEEIPKIRHA